MRSRVLILRTSICPVMSQPSVLLCIQSPSASYTALYTLSLLRYPLYCLSLLRCTPAPPVMFQPSVQPSAYAPFEMHTGY